MGVRAVFLVGFMASGKSSVGKALAHRLQWDFIDLDERIAARENKTVPEIFRSVGEEAFRAAESAALQHLLVTLKQDTVVALGGGAFVREQNRDLLRDWTTIFLDAPADELWQRCSLDPAERPLRKDRGQFAELYEERLPSYRRASGTVDTVGKTPAQVASEIEGILQRNVPETRIDPSGSKNPSKRSPESPSNRSSTGESR
jgi:shikimate kinase